MKDYQERVIQEKKELDQKTKALMIFTIGDEYHDVAEKEKDLLMEQLRTMIKYSMLLGSRIKCFEEA